ncbi:hypothetical protein [Planococcus rifietoensis]|uniref:hypothetical protein n=1 Tax=Planococcus rifietoensis TaxID=200991 RepID=UPI00384E696B
MNWKNNIYFYISIGLLMFCFALLYYMYENSFNLTGFLDVKTILGVGGTIFGAYFGAKTAGKYAIKSVEKQIEAQEHKERARDQKMLEKVMNLYVTHLSTIEVITEIIKKEFSLAEGQNLEDKDIDRLEFSKKEVESQLENLKSVDTSELYVENYYFLLMPIMKLENILLSLRYMIQSIEDTNEKSYNTEFEDFRSDCNDLYEYKELINLSLTKFKNSSTNQLENT